MAKTSSPTYKTEDKGDTLVFKVESWEDRLPQFIVLELLKTPSIHTVKVTDHFVRTEVPKALTVIDYILNAPNNPKSFVNVVFGALLTECLGNERWKEFKFVEVQLKPRKESK